MGWGIKTRQNQFVCKIGAYMSTGRHSKRPLTTETMRETYRRMVYAIGLATDTPTELIHSTTRLGSVVLCRQIVWHYLRANHKYHLRTIAELAEKDHTTILNGIRKVRDEIAADRIETILTYSQFLRTYGELFK